MQRISLRELKKSAKEALANMAEDYQSAEPKNDLNYTTLLYGFLNQFHLFLEKIEWLQQWLEKNERDVAVYYVSSIEEKLTSSLSMLEPYISEHPTFENNELVRDTSIIQQLRHLTETVNQALEHCLLADRTKYIVTLNNAAQLDAASSALHQFGWFKPDQLTDKVKIDMLGLAKTLSESYREVIEVESGFEAINKLSNT